jgi:transcriptional regulator with XRE-family HTH domain
MRTEVRDARVKAGLSQAALARLSGVPRKQVMALESGRNVTLKTFEKIVTQIPGLERIHIGEVEVAMSDDVQQNRIDLMEASQIVKRVLDRIGGPILPEGAARAHGGAFIDPERLKQLEDLIGRMLRGDESTTESAPMQQRRRPGRPVGSRTELPVKDSGRETS